MTTQRIEREPLLSQSAPQGVEMRKWQHHEVKIAQDQVLARALPSMQAAMLTSGSGSCPDLNADVSMFLRTFINIWMDSPCLSAMGMTTAFNSFQGVVATAKAYDRLTNAKHLQDRWGEGEAKLDIARGVIQTGGGLLFMGLRPLSIACNVQNIPMGPQASSLLGRVTFGVGFAGNSVFGLFYGIIGAWAAYMQYRSDRFFRKLHKGRDLNNKDDLTGYVQYLTQKRLETTAESTFAKIEKSCGSLGKAKEHLKNEALSLTQQWIKEMFAEVKTEKGSKKTLSKQECKELVEALYKAFEEVPNAKEELGRSMGLSKERIRDLSFCELCGLQAVQAKRQAKKEAKLARATSGETVAWLKQAQQNQLVERLGSKDPIEKKMAEDEAVKILESAQKSAHSTALWNQSLLWAGIIGMVATALSFVFTGGISAIVIAVVFLVITLMMTYVDARFLKGGLTADSPIGKWDKQYVLLSAGVALLSTVTVIVLAALSLSTGGVAPVVIAALIGVCWLTSCAVSYVMLGQKQQRYEENHPTLSLLQQRLSEEAEQWTVSEKNWELFEKLSQEDQKAIRNDLKKWALQEAYKPYDETRDFGYEYAQAYPEEVRSIVEGILREGPNLEATMLLESLPNLERLTGDLRAQVCGRLYWKKARPDLTNRDLLQAIRKRAKAIEQMEKEKVEALESMHQRLHALLNSFEKSSS